MGCGASTKNDKASAEDPSSMPVKEDSAGDLKFQQTTSKESTEAPSSKVPSPIPSEGPSPAQPDVTDAADATEAPAVTDTADATEAPAVTDAADATEAPEVKPKTPACHSAIRWGKPIAELEEIVGDDVDCPDPGNGNRPIHLAAQNGHLEIVQWLISKKCNVDAQNNTGATALHMAVAYDSYFVVEALLAGNADTSIKNEAGNESITGLDGDKTGSDAWDSGFNMLLSANTAAMAEAALTKIEANPEGVDKGKFAQAGMRKKKEIKDFPKDQFAALMKSL